MLKLMLFAGLGGFVGTCFRYLVGLAAKTMCGVAFPYGTLTVNIVGCLLIGVFYGMAESRHWFTAPWSAILITGFCGGFTTFSSFSDDVWLLLQQKHWPTAMLYVGLSVVVGLLMVWIGRSIVRCC